METIIITLLGSIGEIVRDYTTKEVVPGSYRHTAIITDAAGQQQKIQFKTSEQKLTGAFKLLKNTATTQAGEVIEWWSQLESVKSTAELKAHNSLKEELTATNW